MSPEEDGGIGRGGVSVTPRENGPLVLTGDIELHGPDGSVAARATELFLCRCGRSATKPRCDGSHKRVGFVADGVPVRRRPD